MTTRLILSGFRILRVEPRGKEKLTELTCETLPGGAEERAELRLFPGGRDVTIRSVTERADSYLLKIKGVRRADLSPGMVLISPAWPVTESREGLFLHDGEALPTESEAVRGGLCPDFNRERILPRGLFKRQGAFIVVRFPAPFPMLPGADYTILGVDGKPRVLTLLWPQRPDSVQSRQLNAMAPRRPDPHPDPKEIYGRLLHILGFVRIPPGWDPRTWTHAIPVGEWILERRRSDILRRRLVKIASRPGGADGALLKVEGYPPDLVLAISRDMVAQGELVERTGWYFPPGAPRLSPFHRGWLDIVQKAGEEGIRTGVPKTDADRDALAALTRAGLIKGGAGMWLSHDAFQSLADKLLDGRVSGDAVSMADARATLGGSRVRTLDLLELLEKDGRLSPGGEGDARTVV